MYGNLFNIKWNKENLCLHKGNINYAITMPLLWEHLLLRELPKSLPLHLTYRMGQGKLILKLYLHREIYIYLYNL